MFLRNQLVVVGEVALYELRDHLGVLHAEHRVPPGGADGDLHRLLLVPQQTVQVGQGLGWNDGGELRHHLGGQPPPVHCQPEAIGCGHGEFAAREFHQNAGQYRAGLLGAGGDEGGPGNGGAELLGVDQDGLALVDAGDRWELLGEGAVDAGLDLSAGEVQQPGFLRQLQVYPFVGQGVYQLGQQPGGYGCLSFLLDDCWEAGGYEYLQVGGGEL